MIGSVADKVLDNNGLYMRLKIVNAKKVSEIAQLKDKLAAVEKELEATTIRCESFRCVTPDSGSPDATNTTPSDIAISSTASQKNTTITCARRETVHRSA